MLRGYPVFCHLSFADIRSWYVCSPGIVAGPGTMFNGLAYVVERCVYTVPGGGISVLIRSFQGRRPIHKLCLFVGDVSCLSKNCSQDIRSEFDTSASLLG